MNEKERFENVLRATGRRGVEKVLAELYGLGFYDAPASTRFHGSERGGLLRHSLNVYDEALLIREVQIQLCPQCAERLPLDSVAIAALLHDVCKAEVYRETEPFGDTPRKTLAKRPVLVFRRTRGRSSPISVPRTSPSPSSGRIRRI